MTAFDDAPGFVRLDAAHLESTDAVLVVPSRRLKDAVVETIDLRARRAGRACWASPSVRTVDELLIELFETALAAGHVSTRRLLTGEAARLAANAATREEETHLLSLFESGWQLVNDYELTAEVAGFDDHEGARAMSSWAGAFADRCAREGWLTLPELPAVLTGIYQREPRAAPTNPLVWIGFEHVTPSLRRLRATLTSAGCRQSEVALGSTQGVSQKGQTPPWNTSVVAVADPQAELRRALEWAEALLRESESPQRESAERGVRRHVGIVVPDLVQRYDVVLNELVRVFGDAVDSRAAPYNLSGGLPLRALPLCADALDLLRWCFFAESPTTVGRLLASPFFTLEVGAAPSRSSALPARYDLERFVTTTNRSSTRSLWQRVREWPRRQTLDRWIVAFRQTLRAAGWPGGAVLGSESFQAAHTFESLCDELSDAADVIGACTGPAAFELLASGSTRRPFAPERSWAPVQVLGYLESAGLAFSDLWVTGVTSDAWPAAPHIHPLIPRRWQISRGVPRATVLQETDFARRMIDTWSTAAARVVFSHPREQDGEPKRASALLPVGTINEADASHHGLSDCQGVPKGTDPSGTLTAEQSGDALEYDLLDAVPLRDTTDAVLSATAIRDQSLCPFRAFAIHRLAARESSAPSTFPPPEERGTTLHTALQLVYRDAPSRSHLAALQPTQRTELVERSVHAALVSLLHRAPDAFIATEHGRLVRSVLDWIDVDLRRPEFSCEAVEAEHTGTLAGIPVKLRIDRIDRDTATQDTIVIDYKSGPVSPNHWRGDRPEDPQLPLYATLVPHVREVAFAELRHGATRLNGVTANRDRYPPPSPGIRMQGPRDMQADDWRSLLVRWHTITESLASEYRHGIARVQPLHSGVCRRCHLQTLCRIAERSGRDDE